MDYALTPELEAFRTEVREFIAAVPADLTEKVRRCLNLSKEDYVRFQDLLAAKGWLTYNWPAEHGGPGWSPMQSYIFEEEMGQADLPRIIAFGPRMVGPVIYTFGNQAQKDFYLPRIRNNTDWWCQGYSEPGSGSDLASLQTRAVRDGDHYIVNGSKTWTTLAQHADRIFCLVRTDTEVKKQEGISFLLIDMDTPGIEVQPIITMDGGHEVNSVFFTDVKVPVENRIGEENKGWTYAKFLLSHERSGIARVSATKSRMSYLKEIARGRKVGGRLLADDPDFKREVAETEIQLQALEYTELRYVSAAEGGKAPGAEANMLKIRGTDLQQRVTDLLMKAMGYYAMPYVPEARDHGWNEGPIGPEGAGALAPTYFNMRKASIYGGSNEIQRSILAKMVLGL